MLVRFNVKNAYSFSERTDSRSEEFSMLAGRVRSKREHIHDDGKVKILKFAAVYGANASGKSNLVKAIDLMRRIVLRGFPEGDGDKYCRIDPANRDRPSYFEVEILLAGRYYSYGFEVILSQRRFTSEWLVELLSDDSEREIFTINSNDGSYTLSSTLNGKSLSGRLDIYAEDIARDGSSLFLSAMNDRKEYLYSKYDSLKILNDVYRWFRDSLSVIYPDQQVTSFDYFTKTGNTDEICRLISAFGTGITGVNIVETPIEQVLDRLEPSIRNGITARLEKEQDNLNQDEEREEISVAMRTRRDFFIVNLKKNGDTVKCSTIRFSHGGKGSLFSLSEESDGTVRILDLLEILIAGEGRTYVLDELDRCLHPMLSYKFVETFLSIAEKRNTQLIVTTHESRLMDFDLLRRDEIWFIDKRPGGESDIYSLDEYNARFDQKIDKAYLDGRYGGVPVFSTLFPVEENDS